MGVCALRRKKKRIAAAPFAAGVIAGLAAALAVSAAGAAVIALGGSTRLAGVISFAAVAAGCFFGGRIAGTLRRSGGLKTGALCGAMIFLPMLVLSLVFGQCAGVLMWFKAAICVVSGAAGGVFGVNGSYGRT